MILHVEKTLLQILAFQYYLILKGSATSVFGDALSGDILSNPKWVSKICSKLQGSITTHANWTTYLAVKLIFPIAKLLMSIMIKVEYCPRTMRRQHIINIHYRLGYVIVAVKKIV